MTEGRQENAAGVHPPAGSPNEPQNPTVAFERNDVNIRGIVAFAIGLTLMVGIALVAITGLYSRFQDGARKSKTEFPVAEAVRTELRETNPVELLPPRPRLDGIVLPPPAGRVFPTSDQADSGNARALYIKQEQILNAWHGMDKDHPNPRIPITEAMRRLIAKPGDFLKARPGPRPPNSNDATAQPNAANSGRGADGVRK
jgi:hypothetical protein